MVESRADRRERRRTRVVGAFGAAKADVVLDLLELTELAWHDCYGEVTPPDDIVDDLLLVARGDLGVLVEAARLAVTDWRDLKVWAGHERANPRS